MSASNTPIADVEKALPTYPEKSCTAGNNDDSHSIPSTSSSPQSLNNDEITRIPTHASQSRRTVGGLAKVITARSNASVIDPGPPPDGGIKAWTQSFMGHFVVLNTWGMIASFGVFQQYYSSELGMEPSAVSWIGSMQMLGHFSLGMVSGRAFDAGYFYWTLIPGMVLASLGLFMTSLCNQYWQLFLAQGLMIGVGCGLQFPPVLSLVSTYFSRNRSVALAIMASGAATGGLVYPTIARQLLPKIGFEWTVRIMAFMMLGLGCCYCALLKPRLPPRSSGPLLELSAFSEPPYSIFLIGVFLLCLGQYFATYYIGAFAQDIIGMDYGSSVNVLMVLNGIGVPGRLVPSYFADRYCGPYNTLIPACFICSLLLFLWPLVVSEPGVYGWSVAYGFFVGCYQGLFPSALTSLTKDMSKVGTRNGMGFAIVGLGTLVGPPIAGALIQSAGGNYFQAQMYGGATVFLGSTVLVCGRAKITGWKLMKRA